jgi:hypothetical protein
MYYPYFRGKQFELILLRDKAKFLFDHQIHPIIEPVKNDFKALSRAMEALDKESVNCILIVNPKAGQEPVPSSDILSQLIDRDFKKYRKISLGFILENSKDTKKLIPLLRKYKGSNFAIIHYGSIDGKNLANEIKGFSNIKEHIFIDGRAGKLYQRHFKNDGIHRILVRDGFTAQEKNAKYPKREHFSDLHVTYPDEGMNGFGDYLIVGEKYSETGGPAYAVAIHLTYLRPDEDMYIFHFISDQTSSPTDPGGKFKQALKKLVTEAEKSNALIFKSEACKEFLELHRKGHYPGLGYVKKLSMQHHIELMGYYIQQHI